MAESASPSGQHTQTAEVTEPAVDGMSAPEAPVSPAPEATSDTPGLDQLLAEAQARIDQQQDALMRALADAENTRRRAQQDIAAAHKFALERFAGSLIPVVDSLEAALGAENATADALRSGIELTLRQMRAALDKERIVDIDPQAGERFDPHRHQAMAAVESDADPNTVVSLLQKGWLLHDRVLRPALVTVAKARPANDA